MIEGERLARRVGERERAYQMLATMILACWPVDAILVRHWPLDTLALRASWAGLCLGCIAWGRRRPAGTDAALGVLAIGSCVAMGTLAMRTGGSASPLFYMLPYVPVLASQVEPPRASTLYACMAVLFCIGEATLLREGKGPVSLASWAALVFFLGWWAVYWQRRSLARRAAMVEAERQKGTLERDRARALEELALAEQRRGSTERLAAVGQLAKGVAHEVHNPLASVKSNVEFLLAVEVPPAEREAVLRDTLAGVDRIHRIVEELRDFAREPRAPIDEVDADGAIAEACAIAAPRLRVLATVEKRVDAALPHLRCHRGRLVQVLVNLLANAADAIETAGRTVDGRVIVRAFALRGRVTVEVEDNGPGVPPALAERIFEPFVTTRPAGGGIGLALAREFTESLGGALRVEAGEMGGARFVLELPAAEPVPVPARVAL